MKSIMPYVKMKYLDRLQDLIGYMKNVAINDRDQNRAARIQSAGEEAFELVLAVRCGTSPPDEEDHDQTV